MDIPFGWPGGDWQTTARLAGALIGAYLFLIWAASVLWAYRDIQARTRDPVTRAIGLAVVAALPIVGIPIYLVARPRETLRESYDRQLEQEAILSELHSAPTCPQCRRPVEQDWAICAFCSHELKQPCPSCSRLLLNAWRYCPHCRASRQVAALAPSEASAPPRTAESAPAARAAPAAPPHAEAPPAASPPRAAPASEAAASASSRPEPAPVAVEPSRPERPRPPPSPPIEALPRGAAEEPERAPRTPPIEARPASSAPGEPSR